VSSRVGFFVIQEARDKKLLVLDLDSLFLTPGPCILVGFMLHIFGEYATLQDEFEAYLGLFDLL
jgi:hypothetical protein